MKGKLYFVIQFLIFTVLFYLLGQSSIQGVIFPFGFACLFALAWANQKLWILCPAFVIGSTLSSLSLAGVVSSIVCVTVLSVAYIIFYYKKKPIPKWALSVLAIFSQSGKIAFSLSYGGAIWLELCHLAIGLGFMFLLILLFEAQIVRGFSCKLTTVEMLGGGLFLMALAGGLVGFDFYGFSPLKLLVFFLFLFVNQISSFSTLFLTGVFVSIGTLLPTNNPYLVAPLMLSLLFISCFKHNKRVFSALSLVLSEVLSVYYFNFYYSSSWIQLLPALLAGIAFVCLPNKVLTSFEKLFGCDYKRLAIKNVLNRNREIMQSRLDRLGEVFCEMNFVFRKLIHKTADENQIKEMLYEELKSSICKGCPDNKHCHRTFNDDTKKIFTDLISIALEKGRITLLDLPTYLSSRCGKSKVLISEINTLTNQYKTYNSLVGNVDRSKLLIARQLEGVGGIMKTLAKEVDCMICLDDDKEKKLIESLASENIICQDAIIFQKDAWTVMASLVVREEDSQKTKLSSVVSKVCGCKMCVFAVKQSEKAGFVSVEMKTAPAYDCVFGLSSKPKGLSPISGDKHCIERLDGDRFIFAICDGMGSGEKASEKSETAIGLIENFYKAGFDSEIILSSVNDLLSLEGDEIFSTIDACIVDLKNGIADFVKMGGASSYIRSEEGCQIIENDQLPVGVVESLSVKTQKAVLKSGDFITICSDGISDSFSSDGKLRDFILSQKSLNPQERADQLLEKALSFNSGYAVDDMTVLVVKIFS